jgi:hypothetical protein
VSKLAVTEAGDSLMSEQAHAGETRFQAGIVVDTHIHTMDYLPAFAASTFRWFIRRTVPGGRQSHF